MIYLILIFVFPLTMLFLIEYFESKKENKREHDCEEEVREEMRTILREIFKCKEIKN